MIEVIATALFAIGIFFQLVAALGFVRFPDVYCRLHITGINDTLGGPLVLLGAALCLPPLDAGKVLLAIVFLYLTSPLVGHLLSRAALEAGIKPWQRKDQET